MPRRRSDGHRKVLPPSRGVGVPRATCGGERCTAEPGRTPLDASVVVITRDRRERLLETLERLVALPERLPVLVVDNASSDGTPQAVRAAFPAVQVVTLPHNAGAVARNIGVATAQSRYVAFADDDTWWEPGAIAQGVETMAPFERLAVVTARILVEPVGSEDPICEELERSPLPVPAGFPGRRLVSFLAGASIVRAAPFLAAGGFDERLLIGGEEELLATDLMAAGWWIGYAPDLVVHHAPSPLRDPHERRFQGIRNTLWQTWLRRPLPAAARRTARLLARLPRDAVSARALAAALAGAPWVARERRVVPPEVEAFLRSVEADQLRSKARRYVS